MSRLSYPAKGFNFKTIGCETCYIHVYVLIITCVTALKTETTKMFFFHSTCVVHYRPVL